jgi:hypothetical protein
LLKNYFKVPPHEIQIWLAKSVSSHDELIQTSDPADRSKPPDNLAVRSKIKMRTVVVRMALFY